MCFYWMQGGFSCSALHLLMSWSGTGLDDTNKNETKPEYELKFSFGVDWNLTVGSNSVHEFPAIHKFSIRVSNINSSVAPNPIFDRMYYNSRYNIRVICRHSLSGC